MSFKFVLGSQSVTTSSEATGSTSKDLEGIFIGQSKTNVMQIANTGSSTATYTISVSGVNTDIKTSTEVSLDNVTYATTVVASGVAAGRLSDAIYYKVTPAAGSIVGSGTVYIRADEVVV